MPPKFLNPILTILKAGVVLVVIGWILDIPGRLQIGLFTEQILVTVLGLSLAITFLTFPLSLGETGEEAVAARVIEKKTATVGATDVLLAAAALVSCFYVAIRYQDLIVELVTRPWYGILVAAVIVLLVFEASRRVTGLSLVIIVLLLCLHAMFSYLLPESFAARPVALSRLIVYLGIDTNALLGTTLQIGIVVVAPFIIMGQVLSRCGGSDFFADLAASLMGHFRGGAAKIAVVGSAFFGMISGSAVANVASVGTITIPLMKRAGFPGHIAASIEAVGSTGGQVAPPVMGAAAFLMAEYLQIPYSEVMIAAIIPAFLYYAALFIQVDLESVKLGVLGAPRESLPRLGMVLRKGWHFTIPFIVLIVGLIWLNWEPEFAALCATALLGILAMIVPHNGRRLTPLEVLDAVVSAGGAVVDIIAITAIAGILIGAMSITGVAFSLTQQLLTISGGSTALLLIITAIASFILGLPLPTTGVYIILATLAAPALVQAGIAPMQAHLFVLFNGILGMVTPPVALAAFAAATIARSDQWQTGWTAMRVSWCAYFLPFMFVYTPALIMNDSVPLVLLHLGLCLLGIFIGTVAVVGYCFTRVPWPFRIGYALVALMLLVQPRMFNGADWVIAAGFVLALAALVREVWFARARLNPKPAA
ncbi:MAG TPA: TRAP transporter fused permease subunit [Pseudolabrys sp.]|nr:TRAP transporter fused permease subunit [Pseudolabrys sp.]